MGKSRWLRRLVRRLEGLLVLLILMVAGGCSRPTELPTDDAGLNPADQNKLPFRDNSAKGAGSDKSNPGEVNNTGDASAGETSNRDARTASGAPFQHLGSIPELPAGTLVTVRLEKHISSVRVGDEATFAAAVDEPVLIDGSVAVPSGAIVTGKIESARGPQGRGYIRLTLDTITVAGKKVPLRTSSLFVRGSAVEVLSSGSGQDEVEAASPILTALQKGQHLTFRLASGLPLYQQETVSPRQDHLPGAQ
jgi:hypothetical protein